jgi:hypothetical protein
MRRGQLSLSLLEAGVGVLLLLAVAGALAVGVPTADEREARLDGYAGDTLLTLRDGEPSLGAPPAALDARVDDLAPPGTRYRLETPAGAAGTPVPTGIPVGRARTTTANGTATLWLWYG